MPTCRQRVVLLVQVFLKRRRGRGRRRCWRSRRFLHLSAGCHRMSVMHAHSGGTHGISLRLIAKHTWRCPAHVCRRIPERVILHPLACGCDVLPAVEPEEIASAPPPALPPPPPPPSIPSTCPPAVLATMGWELCTWQLATPPEVPHRVADLLTVPGMSVCSSCMRTIRAVLKCALGKPTLGKAHTHNTQLGEPSCRSLVGRKQLCLDPDRYVPGTL